MRKLLLSSTALATAAALTAGSALADVSISAYQEWAYTSQSSQVAANDGNRMSSESEIHFKFSNKTDSGLTIAMTTEMDADDGAAVTNDENSLSIEGGFGKIVLGGNDNAADNYAIDVEDVTSENITVGLATGQTSLFLTDTDLETTGDANKITYHIPAMGALKAGISYTDNGTDATTGDQDSLEIGASYTIDAGGASITLAGATRNTEQVSGTVDEESQSLGVSVVAGNVTVKVGQATYEEADVEEEANGVGVKFQVNDDMYISAYTVKVEDSLGKTVDESYSNTGGEVAYTIASGLTAFFNVTDYDYKTGTGTGAGTTADSGTVSKLTIQAKF